MSTNCIRCIGRTRTGGDLLCDECRAAARPAVTAICPNCGHLDDPGHECIDAVESVQRLCDALKPGMINARAAVAARIAAARAEGIAAGRALIEAGRAEAIAFAVAEAVAPLHVEIERLKLAWNVARIAVAEEREACARAAEDGGTTWYPAIGECGRANAIAAAIRARARAEAGAGEGVGHG